MSPRRLVLLALVTRELADALAPTWGLRATYHALACKVAELAAEASVNDPNGAARDAGLPDWRQPR